MKKLFDASAIMLLTKNHPQEAPTLLKHEHLLDLTLYELGNTIWKINKLYKKPDKNTAIESLEQAYHLIALMNKHEIQTRQTIISIMENAFQYNLTYYDSAYLTTAQQQKLTLVTEDNQLEQAARKANIPVENTETLITST
jgi:predicted nucleic acid-binding protein